MRIYTDGACFPNPGNGSWAFVVLNENDEIVFKKNSFELNTTNNRMECKAIIEAMKWVVDSNLEHIDITIYSDSQLIVNTYNTWMHKWSNKGWKRKKSEIKNIDLIKELYNLKQITSVELVWIKGHSGILGNELADYLCSQIFAQYMTLVPEYAPADLFVDRPSRQRALAEVFGIDPETIETEMFIVRRGDDMPSWWHDFEAVQDDLYQYYEKYLTLIDTKVRC